MGTLNKFLLFYVLMISTTTLISTNVIAGEELLFEKTISTASDQTLDLDAFAGNVIVNTGSAAEVSVKIYGNQETKDKLDFSAESTANGVSVDVKKNYSGNTWNMNIKIVVAVPQEYNVNAKTGGGNISVSALKGIVVLNSSGGNITIDGITGQTKATTQGGNITLKNFDGNVSAETNGGNVKLAGSNGSVYAATNGGNITLDYSGKNFGIELNTNAGNVKVDVPAQFDADVDMTTTCGRIVTDLGTPADKHVGSSLKTTIGSGGAKLSCSTNAGTISAYKKDDSR